MLMRHASAFGLFMVTDIVRYLAFTFYALHPQNPNVLKIYLIAKSFWLFGSFVSQILLCQIFWDLGSKVEQRPPSNRISNRSSSDKSTDSRTVSVEILPFDEDAEMQAKIWNSLVSTARWTDGEGEKYKVNVGSTYDNSMPLIEEGNSIHDAIAQQLAL